MKARILEDNGIVRNYDAILETFSQRLNSQYVSIYDLEEYLNMGVDIYYYTETPAHIDDYHYEEPEAGVKIIQTKVIDYRTSYPLCFSYIKRKGDLNWNGCLVGTGYYLFKKYFNVVQPSNPISSPSLYTSVLDRDLQEIYNNLYYKENWNMGGNFNFLRDYFKALRKKIEKDVKDGKTDCFSLNKDETSIMFNARLIDIFDNHIHVISSFRGGFIGDVKMVSSTKDLIDNGFQRQMLNLEPTEFFHKLEDIFFKAKIDDFDFTNPYTLNHVINERSDRLPAHVRDKSSIELANLLKTAVRHSITMSQTDYRFVVPMYNIEYNRTQFLMPIYFDFDENMRPANALVVDNTSGFWSIRTILNLREAYLNARLIGVPNVQWLDPVELETK